ncbi:hypothetical protein DFH09DRAFT_1436120, partial [Mycena vulgaris]
LPPSSRCPHLARWLSLLYPALLLVLRRGLCPQASNHIKTSGLFTPPSFPRCVAFLPLVALPSSAVSLFRRFWPSPCCVASICRMWPSPPGACPHLTPCVTLSLLTLKSTRSSMYKVCVNTSLNPVANLHSTGRPSSAVSSDRNLSAFSSAP